MSLPMVTAIAIVALIALASFRTSKEGEARRFPWFWVALPIAVFSAASLLEMLMVVAASPEYGWTSVPSPEGSSGVQFLSNEQFMDIYARLPLSVSRWIATCAGVILGGGGSVVAWRRGRI